MKYIRVFHPAGILVVPICSRQIGDSRHPWRELLAIVLALFFLRPFMASFGRTACVPFCSGQNGQLPTLAPFLAPIVMQWPLGIGQTGIVAISVFTVC